MVTVLGVLAQLSGVLIIIFYDLTMTKILPKWVYIYFVISAFLGQTLDAIDGKHARNTNRSSPLGQLMDHGCDAFSNSFLIIMIAQTHTLGGSINIILIQGFVHVYYIIFIL
jgi:phosphatidylglycerophosphate synthase